MRFELDLELFNKKFAHIGIGNQKVLLEIDALGVSAQKAAADRVEGAHEQGVTGLHPEELFGLQSAAHFACSLVCKRDDDDATWVVVELLHCIGYAGCQD